MKLSSYIRNYDIVGIVKDYNKETKEATIEQRNKLFDGDLVEILSCPVGNSVFESKASEDLHNEEGEKE